MQHQRELRDKMSEPQIHEIIGLRGLLGISNYEHQGSQLINSSAGS